MVADRTQQFSRDRVPFDATMIQSFEQVRPPLQPNFAGQWLADLIRNPRDIEIEGIQRQQCAALVWRHE